MSKVKLTIFSEEPFGVGLYEREDDGQYEVSKVTFGAEPKDYEVYAYFLPNFLYAPVQSLRRGRRRRGTMH